MNYCKLSSILSLSLFCLLVLSACEVTDEAHNGTGQISVYLTDAPAIYNAVHIEIKSVRIKSNNFKYTENKKEGDAGWITINDDPIRVDLLELCNGNTIQLASEELDAGTYHEIRLVLGSDNNVVIDGKSFALKTLSAQQSGLKLNIDANIEEGEIYNLLIDFDAGRSIVETDSGKYILKPVMRSANLEETGLIRGQVEPASVQTSVMAIAKGDTLSTLTKENGEYKIMGVHGGTYDIIFEPNDTAFAKRPKMNVVVKEKQEIDLGTIILQKL